MAILDRALVRLLPAVPKPVERRISAADTPGRLVPGRGDGHGA